MGLRGPLAAQQALVAAELQLGLRAPGQAEHAAMQVLDGAAHARGVAVADAERELLQRQLAHAHGHRRRLGVLGGRVHHDGYRFEEVQLLQALLEVEQLLFGVAVALAESREIGDRLRAVRLQALDAQRAEVVQRAAVGHGEQARLVVGRIDVRGRAAPARARIAVGAQAAEHLVLFAAPGGLPERPAFAQAPSAPDLGQQVDVRREAALGVLLDLALDLERRAADACDGPWVDLDEQRSAARSLRG